MKKYIVTNSKKVFKTIIACVIAVLFVVVSCFMVNSFAPANPKCYHKFMLSTFNGSYDQEGMPKTSWKVRVFKDKGTEKQSTTFVKVNLNILESNVRSLNQIWINVSDFYRDSIEVSSFFGSVQMQKLNKDKPYTLTASDIKKSKDGWFKIYDSKDSKNFIEATPGLRDIWIGFSTEINVREMVFIDSKNELIKAPTTSELYLDNHTHKIEDVSENSITTMFDESALFDMGKVK